VRRATYAAEAANAARNGKTSSMNDERRHVTPLLPYDDLRTSIGDDPAARAELDALHAHLAEPNPDPARITGHVDALRGVHDAEARLANWWDDPAVQGWLKSLGDAGL
jgi:hypothetical protein